ncbi:hypothetical protein P152DRAFT_462505 [Eremomyces bilateralis CBS 781.70]|uniref:ELYS-like domain-containing protein n=1 Tax=Eremomyces bilateralis CBS 781.70 TaxID=1392243 RepID=A0A6G1FRN1_9PEZI|nr:uncharacterized protein P152DRAFT_462505 [Eremomyces bilateralis CBS 781.70]KAF1808505.1 hypothetical protein P152DRAFT_462505 [Eremomyces bilateralis CBS 781.70]
MLDIQDFSDVFSFNHRCHYASALQNEIHENRRKLHGQLFIDRLLELLNIPSAHIYPPRTNAELRTLHESITSAPIPTHHQLSLLFYLLLDLTSTTPSEESDATRFAQRSTLPRKYYLALLGLWCLDRLDFVHAVGYLTEPSLQPVFHEEILGVLLEHCAEAEEEKGDQKAGLKKHGGHNPPESQHLRGLPMSFYVATNMRITSDDLVTRFFRYRCSISIPRAFSFMRSQPVGPHLQRGLLELLIHEALSSESTHKDRANRAMQLINLPMNEDEDGWFEEYLLRGRGRSLHGAADTVTMRRMGLGKVREILKERTLGNQGGGGRWDQLREGLRRGIGENMTIDEYRLQ